MELSKSAQRCKESAGPRRGSARGVPDKFPARAARPAPCRPHRHDPTVKATRMPGNLRTPKLNQIVHSDLRADWSPPLPAPGFERRNGHNWRPSILHTTIFLRLSPFVNRNLVERRIASVSGFWIADASKVELGHLVRSAFPNLKIHVPPAESR